MRISELSRRSGVTIPTIKYYIREGLLPPGERTAANQARYGQEHLDRLDLVRSLREVAGLGVATIKATLDAIDEAAGARGDVPALAIALRALGGPGVDGGGDGEEVRRAARRVDALLGEAGWDLPGEAAGRADLARALVAIERHWPAGVSPSKLLAYTRVAEELARLEIPETWDPGHEPAEALRYAVLGTVLFEPVILALRRLAHVDRSRRLAAARQGPAGHAGAVSSPRRP